MLTGRVYNSWSNTQTTHCALQIPCSNITGESQQSCALQTFVFTLCTVIIYIQGKANAFLIPILSQIKS